MRQAVLPRTEHDSLLLSLLAGASAGVLTGYLHRKLRINVLLAGILVMTMLYSINLRIMDGPNLPIPKSSVSSSLGTYEQVAGKDPLADLFESSAPVAKPQRDDQAENLPEHLPRDGRRSRPLPSVGDHSDRRHLDRALSPNGAGHSSTRIRNESVRVGIFRVTQDLDDLVGIGVSEWLRESRRRNIRPIQRIRRCHDGTGNDRHRSGSLMVGEILLVKKKIVYGLFAPILGGIVYQGILAVVMRYGYRIGFRASDMKLLTAIFIVAVIGFGLVSTNKRMKGKFRLSTIFGGGVSRD